MAKKPNQDVALKKSHEMEVLTDKPSWLTGQGRGMENVGINDIVLPRIELVQPLSPCKDKRDEAAYIPGIEDGMMFNTVSRDSYDSLRVVPVWFRSCYLVFRTRKAGGGFRGSFDTAAEAEAHRQSLEDPSNHEVIQCGEHIILVMKSDGTCEQAVLSMTSTKLKVSRQLNSLIRLRGGEDSFALVFELGSVQQKNDKGTFYNYSIKPVGYAPHPVFMQGEKLHAMLQRGAKMKTAYDDAIDVGSPQDDRGM